jgi:alkylation response protein AidB-like acyl-CoA dehydrogenase
MWVDLPPDDDPLRLEVRAWLDANPTPSGRELAEAGYVAPHWPRPWGIDANPIHQLVIDEELRRANVTRPHNPIAIGWAGPTLLHAGTQEQKDRHLMRMLSGEDFWCQLFSEPEAGSDLANLRTRAVRQGDVYVVSGHKVWASLAQRARYGILLARTDPSVPKQQGISYFICPMDAPGLTIRPIREITGVAMFNEVFLDNVEIPAENLVGQENAGWQLARVTLKNERVSLSKGGVLFGLGPNARDLVDVARDAGGISDSSQRQRLAQVYIEGELLRLTRMRILAARIGGAAAGPAASVCKVFGDRHGQTLMELARDLAGPAGMLDADAGPLGAKDKAWTYGFLLSRALTIGGGTSEIQLNIIAEQALGLPREIDVEAGVPWAQANR